MWFSVISELLPRVMIFDWLMREYAWFKLNDHEPLPKVPENLIFLHGWIILVLISLHNTYYRV